MNGLIVASACGSPTSVSTPPEGVTRSDEVFEVRTAVVKELQGVPSALFVWTARVVVLRLASYDAAAGRLRIARHARP